MHTYIKPIYKKGSVNDEQNYRPISLLPNLSKIFEKTLYSRLMSFLENNNVLSDRQNGFRRGKSTVRALYQAISTILDSLNDKKQTLATYVP